jgi:hypothetical protein
LGEDFREHAKAVAAGKRIVEQNTVRVPLAVEGETLVAALGLDHGIVRAGDPRQHAAIDFPVVYIVIDDENAAVFRQTSVL